eukprot:7894521-Lingulodinium_polyedra.AAC.1
MLASSFQPARPPRNAWRKEAGAAGMNQNCAEARSTHAPRKHAAHACTSGNEKCACCPLAGCNKASNE